MTPRHKIGFVILARNGSCRCVKKRELFFINVKRSDTSQFGFMIPPPNQTIKGVCGLLIGIEEKDGATQLPPSPPRTILGHPN